MRISHYVLLIPGILVIIINTFYDQKGLTAEDDSSHVLKRHNRVVA